MVWSLAQLLTQSCAKSDGSMPVAAWLAICVMRKPNVRTPIAVPEGPVPPAVLGQGSQVRPGSFTTLVSVIKSSRAGSTSTGMPPSVPAGIVNNPDLVRSGLTNSMGSSPTSRRRSKTLTLTPRLARSARRCCSAAKASKSKATMPVKVRADFPGALFSTTVFSPTRIGSVCRNREFFLNTIVSVALFVFLVRSIASMVMLWTSGGAVLKEGSKWTGAAFSACASGRFCAAWSAACRHAGAVKISEATIAAQNKVLRGVSAEGNRPMYCLLICDNSYPQIGRLSKNQSRTLSHPAIGGAARGRDKIADRIVAAGQACAVCALRRGMAHDFESCQRVGSLEASGGLARGDSYNESCGCGIVI